MNMEKKAAKSGRRNFLRLAGMGTLASAATLASGSGKAGAAQPAEASTGGYKETAHVKKAYELSRF